MFAGVIVGISASIAKSRTVVFEEQLVSSTEKLLFKCSETSSAFSKFVFAHWLFAFLSAGFCNIEGFCRFVDFQSEQSVNLKADNSLKCLLN